MNVKSKMTNKFLGTLGGVKDHNSELLLKILDNAQSKQEANNEKEYYIDENWEINADNSKDNNFQKKNSLKKLLSLSFPNKKIDVLNNKDGSQTIFIL